MTKVIFFFAGTGDNGAYDLKSQEPMNAFKDDVVRIYIQGCQHPNVGNSETSPDLEIIANKINNSFTQEGNLDLNKLKQELGTAIHKIMPPAAESLSTPSITNIGLEGFSRGGVAAFAVAKKLDRLGVPIDIVANQPVPGVRSESSSNSLFTKYHDLSECKNIRTATTLLATHKLGSRTVQDYFLTQMVPKFSKETKSNNWLVPYQHHDDWFNHTLVATTFSKIFHENGYSNNIGSKTATPTNVNYDQLLAMRLEKDGSYYTPEKYTQKFFGQTDQIITKHPAYLTVARTKANAFLNTENISINQGNLSETKIYAIAAISKVNNLDNDQKKDFVTMIMRDDVKGEKFRNLVIKADEITHYLECSTKSSQAKNDKIKEHSHAYKQSLFSSAHAYLSNPTPTNKNKNDFEVSLNKAEKLFENNALNIIRNLPAFILKSVAGVLSYPIASIIKKGTTGEPFAPTATSSAQTMKSALQDMKRMALKEEKAEEQAEQRITPMSP